MHQLQLGRSDEVWAIDKTTFNRLLTGSTSRLVLPNLRRLTCDALTATNLRLIPYFLSPHLTHLTLRTHWMDRVSVDDLLPDLRHTIQAIPMQFLQELIIDLGVGLTHHFEDEVSSIIQRSGNSLRVLNTPVFLGEAVVRHVLNLKNLRVWKGVCSPPPTRVSSSSITVPPLRALVLREEAFGWIQWLTRRGGDFLIRETDLPNRPGYGRPSPTWVSRARFPLIPRSSPRFFPSKIWSLWKYVRPVGTQTTVPFT